MQSVVSMMILISFIAQGHSDDLAMKHPAHAEDVMDKVAQKFIDRMFTGAAHDSLNQADLDSATMAKPILIIRRPPRSRLSRRLQDQDVQDVVGQHRPVQQIVVPNQNAKAKIGHFKPFFVRFRR